MIDWFEFCLFHFFGDSDSYRPGWLAGNSLCSQGRSWTLVLLLPPPQVLGLQIPNTKPRWLILRWVCVLMNPSGWLWTPNPPDSASWGDGITGTLYRNNLYTYIITLLPDPQTPEGHSKSASCPHGAAGLVVCIWLLLIPCTGLICALKPCLSGTVSSFCKVPCKPEPWLGQRESSVPQATISVNSDLPVLLHGTPVWPHPSLLPLYCPMCLLYTQCRWLSGPSRPVTPADLCTLQAPKLRGLTSSFL